MSYTKNRKIKAIRLSDGKSRLFDTLRQAAKACHVTTGYIKSSMTDSFHKSNRIKQWSAYTTRGTLKKTPKPEFRFEEVFDNQLTLIPTFEGEENVSLPSVYAAAKFLRQPKHWTNGAFWGLQTQLHQMEMFDVRHRYRLLCIAYIARHTLLLKTQSQGSRFFSCNPSF